MNNAIAAILLALAALCGLPQDARAEPPRGQDEADPPEEGSLPPAETFCLRAERLLEEDSRLSVLEARRLMEEAAGVAPSAACIPATLSRALSVIYLRQFAEDDALVGKALEQARASLAREAGSARGLAALAIALLTDLQPVPAREAAEAALSRAPDSPAILRAAASVRLSTGDIEGARTAVRHALELRPDLPLHHHMLGNVEYLGGAESEAIAAYRSALALNPAHAPSLIQLALAMDQAGEPRRAAGLFRQVMDQDPAESSRTHVAMARALMRRGGWEPALELLGRTKFQTRRGFGLGTIAHLRGLCLEELGQLDEAEAAYRRVIDEFPESTPGPGSVQRLADMAYEGLARVATRRNDPDAAARALESGGARPEAGPALLVALARFYRTYNMPEKSLATFELAAARFSTPSASATMASAFVDWARLALSRGDRGSLDRLSRSIETARPHLEAARDELVDLDVCRALSIAGRGEEAAGWLARAVARGYRQLEWLTREPEMEALCASRRFAALKLEAGGAS